MISARRRALAEDRGDVGHGRELVEEVADQRERCDVVLAPPHRVDGEKLLGRIWRPGRKLRADPARSPAAAASRIGAAAVSPPVQPPSSDGMPQPIAMAHR